MKQPSDLSIKIVAYCKDIESKWDYAIEVATEELHKVEAHERALLLAIRTFRQNKKEGVPWPEHHAG